jgi:hypothetical protein
VFISTTPKEIFLIFEIKSGNEVVDCCSGLFPLLEFNGAACFALADCCSVNCVTMRSYILNQNRNHIACSKLTIDGKIEHRQIANFAGQL